MAINPQSILIKEEMVVERTPKELTAWVERKLLEFKGFDCLKERVLLHKGLFKKFYEEVYPLNIFVNKLYKERSDVGCTSNLDNQDFDAVICDYSFSPPHKLRVEFTCAIEYPDEHMRMKYFLGHGHVNVYGKLSYTGTKKTGHKIHVENEMIDRDVLLQKKFLLIKKAAEQKSMLRKLKKYGRKHVLVIFFDDCFLFNSEDDVRLLENFVKTNVLPIPLNFKAVYVLGLSGKTFLSF